MYPAVEINLHSTAFALLNDEVLLRLGTRFGASIGGTNLLPRPGWIDRSGVPNQAGRDVDTHSTCRASSAR